MESTTATIEFAPNSAPAITFTYRFWRGVIRLWFALTFRKIRVLHEDRLMEADPALLLVSHPESFYDALILVAGFERQVRCLIPARLAQRTASDNSGARLGHDRLHSREPPGGA